MKKQFGDYTEKSEGNLEALGASFSIHTAGSMPANLFAPPFIWQRVE